MRYSPEDPHAEGAHAHPERPADTGGKVKSADARSPTWPPLPPATYLPNAMWSAQAGNAQAIDQLETITSPIVGPMHAGTNDPAMLPTTKLPAIVDPAMLPTTKLPAIVDPAMLPTVELQVVEGAWSAPSEYGSAWQASARHVAGGRQSSISSRLTYMALACLITAVGGFLRWWQLGVPGLSVAEIDVVTASEGAAHVVAGTPLLARSTTYPFLLHSWISIFGTSGTAVRALSALCGTLTVVAVFVLARQMAGPHVALLASALLAVSPLHIAYSQQVGYYALLALASTLQALLTLLVLNKPQSLARWAAWMLWAVFVVNVAVSGLILLVSLAVVCALRLRYSKWALLGVATAVAAAALTLAIETYTIWGPAASIATISTTISPSAATTGLLADTVIAFGARQASATLPGILALPFIGLVGLGVALLVRARRERNAAILLAWLLGTPALLFLVSFVIPIYDLSLVLCCLPAFVILAAVGIVQVARSARRFVRHMTRARSRRIRRAALTRAAVAVTVIVVAGGLLAANVQLDMHYFRTYQGDPWSTAIHHVMGQQREGDVILVAGLNGDAQAEFEYYSHGGSRISAADPLVTLPSTLLKAAASGNGMALAQLVLQLSELIGNHSRVWVIVQDDKALTLQNWLATAMPGRFSRVGEHVYVGQQSDIVVSLWAARESPGASG